MAQFFVDDNSDCILLQLTCFINTLCSNFKYPKVTFIGDLFSSGRGGGATNYLKCETQTEQEYKLIACAI